MVFEGIDSSCLLLSLDEDGDINVMIPYCFDISRLCKMSVEIGTGAFLISTREDQVILSKVYFDVELMTLKNHPAYVRLSIKTSLNTIPQGAQLLALPDLGAVA